MSKICGFLRNENRQHEEAVFDTLSAMLQPLRHDPAQTESYVCLPNGREVIVQASTLVIGGTLFSAASTVLLFAVVGSAMNLFLILFVGRWVLAREDSVTFDVSGV